jgi:putative transposase
MMLVAVEKRFGTARAPHAIEHLSDNGSAHTAKETSSSLRRSIRRQPFAGRQPASNGMSEAFVKTLKRDYIRISPLLEQRPRSARSMDGSRNTPSRSHCALKIASARHEACSRPTKP